MIDFDEKCYKISIVEHEKALKVYIIVLSTKLSSFCTNSNLRQSDFFFGTEEVNVIQNDFSIDGS